MEHVYAIDGSEIELKTCARPFSFFFDLIQPLWHGSNLNPMHRICSLMRKMGVQSYVLEKLEDFPELREETSSVSARIAETVTGTAYRVSFFRSPSLGDWHALSNDECLGYALIIKLDLSGVPLRTYILEAVVRTPVIWCVPENQVPPFEAPLTNYYIHCSKVFRTTLGTRKDNREFCLKGTFFCQQNGLTHVCAHAAIRTAFISSSLSNGKKLTNEMINRILGIDHIKQKVGRYGEEKLQKNQGLDAKQIAQVARHLDLDVLFADFTQSPETSYPEFVYPLVESGLPTILAIKTAKQEHALAVLGHTTNSDRWIPEARRGYAIPPIPEYIAASAWADHLVVADDNFGMYVTLQSDALSPPLRKGQAELPAVPASEAPLQALLAIGLVPKGVETTGYEAEQATSLVAQNLLTQLPENANRWLTTLRSAVHPLVCRTLLQTREAYLSSMREAVDADGRSLSKCDLDLLEVLPQRFWVTELTIPNLFAGNKRKLGDVLSSCTPSLDEARRLEEVIFAWLPSHAWIGKGYPANDNHPHETVIPWSIGSHVPILRGSGVTKPLLEW